MTDTVLQPLTDLVAIWVVGKGDPLLLMQLVDERVIVTEIVMEGVTVYVGLLVDGAGVLERVALKDPVRVPVGQYVVLSVDDSVFGFVVIKGETVGYTVPLLVA